MNESPAKLYFNFPQQRAMYIAAKDEYVVAGRGSGKTEGIIAPRLIRNVFAMPRSSGAIIGATYKQLLTRTLPSTFHALERMGYIRDRHYFVGRHPPKSYNFKTPYIDPFSYDHVVCWFNGSIQHLISQDRVGSTNSMSLDYLIGDEAKFLNFDRLKDETFQANRGNINYFKNCPWHHGQVFTTDMPTSQSAAWILDKVQEMDPELIRTIEQLFFHIHRLKQNPTSESSKKRIASLSNDLALLRSKATLYLEFSALDNIEVLGEEFIRQMKRDLPPLVFRTSILNERIRKVQDGFYSSLNSKVHYYDRFDNSRLDDQGFDFEKIQSLGCRQDADIANGQPLSIALDYGANINCLVVGQVIDNSELRFLKSFYVKTPRKLKDVVSDFCDYYIYHPVKTVNFFYDATAIAQHPVMEYSYKDEVIRVLQSRGWYVDEKYIGKPVAHKLKQFYWDLALKGQKYLFPTFNRFNCEYLILSMEQAGIIYGRNGFEKDKSKERDPEYPQEEATHISDAADTLYIGHVFYPSKFPSSINNVTNFGELIT